MMKWVTETGSVKRRRVSIAYTATRAAEGIAIVGGCAHVDSRYRKGVNVGVRRFVTVATHRDLAAMVPLATSDL